MYEYVYKHREYFATENRNMNRRFPSNLHLVTRTWRPFSLSHWYLMKLWSITRLLSFRAYFFPGISGFKVHVHLNYCILDNYCGKQCKAFSFLSVCFLTLFGCDYCRCEWKTSYGICGTGSLRADPARRPEWMSAAYESACLIHMYNNCPKAKS